MIDIKKVEISLHEKSLVNISLRIVSSLALIGESGSGKSLTLKALLGMLPRDMHAQLEYEAQFCLKAGETLSLVPQNPFTALSPLTKIERQFFGDKSRIKELFDALGLRLELLKHFPSELSGGELQRVVLAIALESKPELLLLDEPTTALDPKTKEQIIALLKELASKEKFKMLFVTHDIASAQNLCEDVAILKEGKIVEHGSMAEVIADPQEAYTKKLIEANFAYRKFRE